MGGRTSTQVANANHETVYVKVDTKRSYVVSRNFAVSVGVKGVSGSASGGTTWNFLHAGTGIIFLFFRIQFINVFKMC